MTESDAAFVRAVEQCELASLSHRDHIRLAWLILQEQGLLEAIGTLRELFQAFATSKGSPEVFHETITWAFAALMNERIQRGRGGTSWQEFITLNPDLSRGKSALWDYYDSGILDMEIARRTFVLPGAASADTE